jgi:hypothetical protein
MSITPPLSHKIAIVGAGSVGGAIAQALILRRVVAEIILVDIDAKICMAQVNDLSDAAHLSNCKVTFGDSRAAGQAEIIIISAGAKQRPGETRLGLIEKNFYVLQSVIKSMQPIRSDAILLLVSNPVDVLTYFAKKLSGLPWGQVIGSGTLLDSVRLKSSLAKLAKVAETSINAWVIGEHGDSQCVGHPVTLCFSLTSCRLLGRLPIVQECLFLSSFHWTRLKRVRFPRRRCKKRTKSLSTKDSPPTVLPPSLAPFASLLSLTIAKYYR